MPVFMKITKSEKSGKKYTAVFSHKSGGKIEKIKTTHFGSAGMEDYTITKNKDQRKRYIDRHRKNENWNDYKSAGALSRWILWGDSTSIRENIKSYKKRFKLR
tara:strand:+ start:186 stop:494 length:309 start_codon:yes stop_codon:yes gene_type:complete